ncbi:MAG: SPFH domain-containing protein [Oscillospiraceae bacterium]|jgi:membrane protease subunit (stomatin/prohibitin family)|nr:SPFH domain-containing protein [Oscillospiraceae bacterium]
MGIIKAVLGAVGGGLADQWLEVIEAGPMGDTTIMTRGVPVRRDSKRSSNTKGSADAISNGSVIQVYPNQFMLLTDGGKIVDYSAEPGTYKVDNSSMPSLFNGEFGKALEETFSRVKFGGVPSASQRAYFINLKEIKGIKFGTPNPVNYFDNFYNAELYLRSFGSYSIKVADPLKFFTEVLSYSSGTVDINSINEQYQNEFLSALSAALNQMSADGIRVSYVASKSMELSKYMASILDDDWNEQRGMLIQSVGIASISYDEESKKLISIRSEGAMLGDANIREGYVQGAVARGIESAGSNSAGAGAAFMGVGMGMNAAGGFMQAASNSNNRQMANQQANQVAAVSANGWRCSCGAAGNTGNFCAECGKPNPEAGAWICQCGAKNNGKFCAQCGAAKPDAKCKNCGWRADPGNLPKFCPECGSNW